MYFIWRVCPVFTPWRHITGLWQPSVVAFWSFNVSSPYHCEAEFTKCLIVHPLLGNWAGFRPLWDRLVLPYWWSTVAIVILLSTRGTADSDNWHLQLPEKAMLQSYHMLDLFCFLVFYIKIKLCIIFPKGGRIWLLDA